MSTTECANLWEPQAVDSNAWYLTGEGECVRSLCAHGLCGECVIQVSMICMLVKHACMTHNCQCICVGYISCTSHPLGTTDIFFTDAISVTMSLDTSVYSSSPVVNLPTVIYNIGV